jgi:hypothetical protein
LRDGADGMPNESRCFTSIDISQIPPRALHWLPVVSDRKRIFSLSLSANL